MTSTHRSSLWVAALLAGVLFAAGCDSAGPSAESGPLQATLTIEPAIVERGGKFIARVDLTNRGDEPVVYTLPTCEINIAVEHDLGPGAFPRVSTILCLESWVDTIAVGGRVTYRTALFANVSRGTYRVRVDLEGLPTLKAPISIRGAP